MHRRHFIIALFLSVLSVFGIVTTINSCQCGGPPPAKEALVESYLVFVGRVTEAKDNLSWWRRLHDKLFEPNYRNHTFQEYECTYGFEFTFAVEQAIKGKCEPEIIIITGRGWGDCGYPFEKGKRYLVYAYKRIDGLPGTNICTRTKPIDSAKEEIAELTQVGL